MLRSAWFSNSLTFIDLSRDDGDNSWFFPGFLSTASTVGSFRRRAALPGTDTVPNSEHTFKYIHSVAVLIRAVS